VVVNGWPVARETLQAEVTEEAASHLFSHRLERESHLESCWRLRHGGGTTMKKTRTLARTVTLGMATTAVLWTASAHSTGAVQTWSGRLPGAGAAAQGSERTPIPTRAPRLSDTPAAPEARPDPPAQEAAALRPVRYVWGDFDKDGFCDLLLLDTRGNRFFLNVGGEEFEDQTLLFFGDDAGRGIGGLTGDYDLDGWTDLFLIHQGGFTLFRNERGLRFADVTESTGLESDLRCTEAHLFDFDGDGFGDLLVRTPASDRIFRNRGGRTFEEVDLPGGSGGAVLIAGDDVPVIPGGPSGQPPRERPAPPPGPAPGSPGSSSAPAGPSGSYSSPSAQPTSGRLPSAGVPWADDDWDYWSNAPHMFNIPTGNVGIGTTTPTELLDVNGNVKVGTSVVYSGFDGPADVIMEIGDYDIYADNIGTGSDNTRFWLNAPDGGEIVLGPRAGGHYLDLLRFQSRTSWFDGGKLGIGTSSPAEALHVAGDIRLNGGGDLAFGGDNTRVYESGYDLYATADDDLYLCPDDDVLIRADGASDWAIFDSGNQRLGLGTVGPAERLHVAGDIRLNSGGDVAFGDDNTRVHESADDLYATADDDLYLCPDDDVRIRADGASDWAIFESGNQRLGIGTTSPQTDLHVDGGVRIDNGNLTVTNSTYGLEVTDSSVYGVWAKGHLGNQLHSGYASAYALEVHAHGDTATNNGLLVYGQARVTGDLHVFGTLSKGSGSFKIDHPLEPADKYLYHSFVESPDMMNIYNGNVLLDEEGEAWVALPDWFEALNMEFRYQLSCIGAFAPVYVAEEIADNRFKIAGGEAGTKVSWQVTGIRHDPYAEMNRIQVEVDKQGDERGRYLAPEAYGLPETMSTAYSPRE